MDKNGKKKGCLNPIRSTFLTNLCAPLQFCYSDLSSPSNCQLAYNYHDCRTLTMVCSIYDSTEEAMYEKWFELSQKNNQEIRQALTA